MNLDPYRRSIDDLDRELVRLLNERTRLAVEIGRVKQANGAPVFVPARERDVLDKVAALNQGPLLDGQLHAIYREIMSAAISLEHDITVAFPGPEASPCSLAAYRKFGQSVRYLASQGGDGLLSDLREGRALYAVVPAGPIAETLAKQAFPIISEVVMAGLPDGGPAAAFWVLGREAGPASGKDKTTVFFTLDAGAAFPPERLTPGQDLLLRWQRWPLAGAPEQEGLWLDLKGHAEDALLRPLLAAWKRDFRNFAVLGSYPAALPL